MTKEEHNMIEGLLANGWELKETTEPAMQGEGRRMLKLRANIYCAYTLMLASILMGSLQPFISFFSSSNSAGGNGGLKQRETELIMFPEVERIAYFSTEL